jgi:SAM-dependent methyltransferase
MRASERSHINRTRAESFGALAGDYDRWRPSYPSELIDDLVADAPASALDVGCGTGKAARLIAERGIPVLGVELDDRMAEIARWHGVQVEVAGFEDWDSRGRRFDLVTSGQAWHWIDPARGAHKAADLLWPGRLLATFWNFATWDAPTRHALDAAYDRWAPELNNRSALRGSGPATMPPIMESLVASGRFPTVDQREYPWRQVYTTEEWIGVTRTHSDHSMLPREQLDGLTSSISAAIDDLGGTITAHYWTHALLARTPSD